jgi:hypothetical protein
MRTMSVAERFWSHVQKTAGCWTWKGATRSGGYGVFRDGTRSVSAHRFAWEMEYGPIPHETGADGTPIPWLISHMCGNRRCVRPDHLRLLPPVASGVPESESAVPATDESVPSGEAPVPFLTSAVRPIGRGSFEPGFRRGLRSWQESIERGVRLSAELASSICALREELEALRVRGVELLGDACGLHEVALGEVAPGMAPIRRDAESGAATP